MDSYKWSSSAVEATKLFISSSAFLILYMLLWHIWQFLPILGKTPQLECRQTCLHCILIHLTLWHYLFLSHRFFHPVVQRQFTSYPFITQRGASTCWMKIIKCFRMSRAGQVWFFSTNTVWKGLSSIHVKNDTTRVSLYWRVLQWHNWCIKLEIAIISNVLWLAEQIKIFNEYFKHGIVEVKVCGWRRVNWIRGNQRKP